MLSETDKYLINKIRAGDYFAFETLFKCYYRSLVRMARIYVLREEVAEDIVQDLFVKIWEQPSLLNINISIRGYLNRSIYNSCINYILRKQKIFKDIDQTTKNKIKDFLQANPEDSLDVLFAVSELSSIFRIFKSFKREFLLLKFKERVLS